jgi:hypothetical protein
MNAESVLDDLNVLVTRGLPHGTLSAQTKASLGRNVFRHQNEGNLKFLDH